MKFPPPLNTMDIIISTVKNNNAKDGEIKIMANLKTIKWLVGKRLIIPKEFEDEKNIKKT